MLRDDIRLPSEEEIRNLVTPEQCCAYYSMLSAEQRLRDAGYGDKYLQSNEDDDATTSTTNTATNQNNVEKIIEDEIKNAPWYTTRAYLDAIKGKCTLQIFNRCADPTGCGEGFSYIKQPQANEKETKESKKEKKLQLQLEKEKQQQSMMSMMMMNTDSMDASSPQTVPLMDNGGAGGQKKTVTGTDADLRRLHLSQARELVKKYGVPDSLIMKLSRWEIIDVLRTLSTQKAKEGDGAVSKFARGGVSSKAASALQTDEKYKEELQRLFDLQNKNLASEDFLSTDDEDEDDDMEMDDIDSDVDELGKNLESMLQDKMKREQSSNKMANNSSNQQQMQKSKSSKSSDKKDDSEKK